MDTDWQKPIPKRHLKQVGKLNGIWVLGDKGIIANFVGVIILLYLSFCWKKFLLLEICTQVKQWNLLNNLGKKKSKWIWSGKDETRTRVLMAVEAGWRCVHAGHYTLYFCTCLEVSLTKKEGMKINIWQKLKMVIYTWLRYRKRNRLTFLQNSLAIWLKCLFKFYTLLLRFTFKN